MPEKELIWTISSLRIDRKVLAESEPIDLEADENPDAWKRVSKFPVDWRMWGYSLSPEGAHFLVTHNGQFLNEAGYYPWVVVETLEGGTILPHVSTEKDQIFYEAVPDGYDGAWPKSKYVRMDAPPEEVVKLFERFGIVQMFSVL